MRVGQPSVGKPISVPSSPNHGASGLGSVRGDGSYYDVRARDNFEGSIRGKNKPSQWAESENYHDVHQNTGKPIGK